MRKLRRPHLTIPFGAARVSAERLVNFFTKRFRGNVPAQSREARQGKVHRPRSVKFIGPNGMGVTACVWAGWWPLRSLARVFVSYFQIGS